MVFYFQPIDNSSYQLFTNYDVIYNEVFLSVFLYRRIYKWISIKVGDYIFIKLYYKYTLLEIVNRKLFY